MPNLVSQTTDSSFAGVVLVEDASRVDDDGTNTKGRFALTAVRLQPFREATSFQVRLSRVPRLSITRLEPSSGWPLRQYVLAGGNVCILSSTKGRLRLGQGGEPDSQHFRWSWQT
jgi:hypothetical protein